VEKYQKFHRGGFLGGEKVEFWKGKGSNWKHEGKLRLKRKI
jgi:hypothetical protein